MRTFGFTPDSLAGAARSALPRAAPEALEPGLAAGAQSQAQTPSAVQAAANAWAGTAAVIVAKARRPAEEPAAANPCSPAPRAPAGSAALGASSIAWKAARPAADIGAIASPSQPVAVPGQSTRGVAGTVDLVAIHAQLRANQQQWKSFGLEDYSYTVQQVENGPRVKVNVVGGRVVSRIDAATGQLLAPDASHQGTIDDLFAKIRFGVEHRARQLEVAFDSGFGYPTYIFLDMHGDLPDKNVRDLVTSFRI